MPRRRDEALVLVQAVQQRLQQTLSKSRASLNASPEGQLLDVTHTWEGRALRRQACQHHEMELVHNVQAVPYVTNKRQLCRHAKYGVLLTFIYAGMQ